MGLGLTLTVRRKKPAVVVNSQGKGQTGPADPLAGVESVQPGRLEVDFTLRVQGPGGVAGMIG